MSKHTHIGIGEIKKARRQLSETPRLSAVRDGLSADRHGLSSADRYSLPADRHDRPAEKYSTTPVRHGVTANLPAGQTSMPVARHGILDNEQETVSLINESFSSYDHSVSDSDEGGQLSIDVLQNDEEIVLIAATAGLNKNEIEVLINDETLTIRGRRQFPLEKSDYETVTEECFWGNFSRHIILPKGIDRSGISATYKKCILIITIPKIDDQRSKVIKIT